MSFTSPIQADTTTLPWVASRTPGVHEKWVTTDFKGNFEAAVIRLDPGASLPFRSGLGQEVLVREGCMAVPGGELGPGGYARWSESQIGQATSPSGCTGFMRNFPLAGGAEETVYKPANDADWGPGHGNLQVLPLHAVGTEGTALVHWPAGERFVPHRHWGGEEIFVLCGTFEDEHGRYPAGTWLLSPHLSSHHPFVREATTIFVKTGHLGGDLSHHPSDTTDA